MNSSTRRANAVCCSARASTATRRSTSSSHDPVIDCKVEGRTLLCRNQSTNSTAVRLWSGRGWSFVWVTASATGDCCFQSTSKTQAADRSVSSKPELREITKGRLDPSSSGNSSTDAEEDCACHCLLWLPFICVSRILFISCWHSFSVWQVPHSCPEKQRHVKQSKVK